MEARPTKGTRVKPQPLPPQPLLEETDPQGNRVTGTDPDRYMTRTRIDHKRTIGAPTNKVETIGLGNLNVTTNYG